MLCPSTMFNLCMSIYYVQPLYVHIIMFKKFQKQNEIFCEDENIPFYFLGTKIKIRYIFREEKLI